MSRARNRWSQSTFAESSGLKFGHADYRQRLIANQCGLVHMRAEFPSPSSKHKSATDHGFVAGALGHAIRRPWREGGARNVGETDYVIDDHDFYRARTLGLQ